MRCRLVLLSVCPCLCAPVGACVSLSVCGTILCKAALEQALCSAAQVSGAAVSKHHNQPGVPLALQALAPPVDTTQVFFFCVYAFQALQPPLARHNFFGCCSDCRQMPACVPLRCLPCLLINTIMTLSYVLRTPGALGFSLRAAPLPAPAALRALFILPVVVL